MINQSDDILAFR